MWANVYIVILKIAPRGSFHLLRSSCHYDVVQGHGSLARTTVLVISVKQASSLKYMMCCMLLM